MPIKRITPFMNRKLQFVEDTMYAIEDGMTDAGFDAARVRELSPEYVQNQEEQDLEKPSDPVLSM